MKFTSAYERNTAQETPSGTTERPTYGYKVNKIGVKQLVENGTENTYEKIQEHLEETKIENILARVVAGDTTMLRPEGIYADITEMPKSMIEAQQKITELENLWTTIPNEVKNIYNNSVEEFIGDSGSDKWLNAMGLNGVNVEMEKTTNETPKAQSYGEVKTGEGVNNES